MQIKLRVSRFQIMYSNFWPKSVQRMLISMKWQGRKHCVLRAHNSIKCDQSRFAASCGACDAHLTAAKGQAPPPFRSRLHPASMWHLHALQFTLRPSGLGTSAGNCPLCFSQRSLMPLPLHLPLYVCVCCTLMSCAQLHVNLLLHFAVSFFAWHLSAPADSCWILSISCTGCLATWSAQSNSSREEGVRELLNVGQCKRPVINAVINAISYCKLSCRVHNLQRNV